MSNKSAIARNVNVASGTPAFDGDLFERKPLALMLTKWIDRLPDGGVLAVDAPWGSGKSWFGEHWRRQLQGDQYRTIWFDAFESDYVDDPFLLVMAEFRKLLAGADAKKASFTKKAAALARSLLPALAKGSIHAAGRFVLGDKVEGQIEEAIEKIGQDASELVGKQVEERLDELEKLRDSVAAFQTELEKLATSGDGKPIVVFVDELDRCRPTFAVQFLERLKHFFEVRGVVFVLLLNRKQLERAIRGMYGAETEAGLYLHKFITLAVTLPTIHPVETRRSEFPRKFLGDRAQRLGIPQTPIVNNVLQELGELAVCLSLSYRDLERALGYYSLLPDCEGAESIVAYLIALRVRHEHIFSFIASGAPENHTQARQALDKVAVGDTRRKLLHGMRVGHKWAAKQQLPQRGTEDSDPLRAFFGGRGNEIDPARQFQYWCGQLDLRID